MLVLILSMFLAMAGEGLAELIPRMEHAAVVASVKQLEECRDALLAILKTSPESDSEMARYSLAYVDWRLHPLLSADRARQKDAANDLVEGQSMLKHVIAANPSHAEARSIGASDGSRPGSPQTVIV